MPVRTPTQLFATPHLLGQPTRDLGTEEVLSLERGPLSPAGVESVKKEPKDPLTIAAEEYDLPDPVEVSENVKIAERREKAKKESPSQRFADAVKLKTKRDAALRFLREIQK